jgi:BRCT domain type II-containing protein
MVVEDGLRADEWVIIEGLQRARRGAEVAPKQTEISTTPDQRDLEETRHADPPPETQKTNSDPADNGADSKKTTE